MPKNKMEMNRTKVLVILTIGAIAMLLYIVWSLWFENTAVEFKRPVGIVFQKIIKAEKSRSDIDITTNKQKQITEKKIIPVKKTVKEDMSESEEVAKAIRILKNSVEFGDNRSPEISHEPLQRLRNPDPETLANPEEYIKKQNEAREAELPEIYEATSERLISIQEKIEEAENDYSHSPEEIDEAREAYEQLLMFQEKLKEHLEKDEPSQNSEVSEHTGPDVEE